MKKLFTVAALLLVLTVSAQKGKWVTLFDGKSIKGWHIYNKANEPISGWHVMNGVMMTHGKNGNITTDKE